MKKLIDILEREKILSKQDFKTLIASHLNTDLSSYLFQRARFVREQYYGKDIYIRGLIEISNYCKNDCYYCGIRRSNRAVERYRLTKEEILTSCEAGYRLGFRTFVLQGGEDGCFSKNEMVDMIKSIKNQYSDCAITLSLGEYDFDTYFAFFQAGADRYLLRHETANSEHYRLLHPSNLCSETRKRCLNDLREIGYQVGTGFMVGSPFQTDNNLAEDLLFIADFKPHMVGIGPFIAHHQTPFAHQKNGTLELTLFMLGLLRLMLPSALLPSTTALASIDPEGREKGILAGANVIMPNLSPLEVREKYMIYDNKASTGLEASESLSLLSEKLAKMGYSIVVARGDFCEERRK